jgi:hypothetical protein
MEVKIQCECGSRFAFDVEPVNGRMPVRVNCPVCDADVTDLANETIRQKLTPTAVPPPPAIPAPVAILPETPAPARQPIRLAVSTPQTTAATTAAAPVAAAGVAFCPRHPKNPAVETCRVCGKPICGDCMEHYGYTCSTYCRKRAEETGMDLPVYGKQRSVVGARMARVGALVWRTAIVLGAIFVGAWVWYTFFGSQPHVIYSESLPHGDRARFYQFLSSGQVLSMKANRMSLIDVARKQQVWSVPLNVGFSPPPPPDPNQPNIEEEVELYPPPRIIARSNDLWILFPGRLVQYDRRSGNSKQEIPLNPPYSGLAQHDDGLTMISADEAGRQTITRIAFADGTVRTEPVQPAGAAAAPTNNPAKPPAKPPATTLSANNQLSRILATTKSVLPANARPVEPESVNDQFVTDGTDVVQMKVTLIEHKTIAHQAMKPQKKTLVDNNLTAGQSQDAAEQMINETRREQTGGVEEEDVSRYQITLRRLPAGDASDWTGEAIGPPSYFALKTMNVLASGKTIQVFDKHNKKLWAANLTYRIPARYAAAFDPEADAPCAETSNTLYVFDQGMLTSFDAATGDVHWRLTSVGISQVQPDGKGNLYVTSTTASPDTIQFSQQVDFSSRSGPVVLKVASATGKVLWRTEGIGDRCFVSGNYVYLSKAAESPLTGPGEDPIFNFDLYRVSPSDGHAMWDYSQTRLPVQIEVQGNEILLHFWGELQVVKFLSL